jgi:8-amino-7-oxononanoate synthase
LPDFTSSLYLGLRHASGSLEPWSSLTTGVPAALRAPPQSDAVARSLAALVGTERAVLYPSTLHAFCDLLALLGRDDVELVMEAGSYPIAAWALERAAARGVTTSVVSDVTGAFATVRRRPVLIADGVRTGRDRQPPIRRWLDLTRSRGGLLVLDDTQALGVLGTQPRADSPYGDGGGGSVRHAGVRADGAVVVASLAKAFGAPVAVVAGPALLVERLVQEGETRMHSSPPSAAAIAATAAALRINARAGDMLRGRLASRVRRLRDRAREQGLIMRGGLLPFQTLALEPAAAVAAHERLAHAGVRAVLHRDARGAPTLSFLVTAAHSPTDIDRAVEALTTATRRLEVRR